MLYMVRRAGLEPARPNGQEILSLSCLPNSTIRASNGGTYGSCTRLRGFADRCVTAPPTRHAIYDSIPDDILKKSKNISTD